MRIWKLGTDGCGNGVEIEIFTAVLPREVGTTFGYSNYSRATVTHYIRIYDMV